MKKTRTIWLPGLLAALSLGLAACDARRPPEVAAAKQPVVEPSEAKSPKGAAAGTAEEKMFSRADGTKPGSPPDQVLAEKVKAALGADPTLETSNVDVVAANGTVTLVGTADNSASRDKASRIAQSVQGVSSVENRMVVVRGS